MYQLMIVDDEASVVDSLALTIPWEEYGVEKVHRAYSVQEALRIANTHAVDIIITDIQMPEMNGLELIDRVRHFSRKVRCIILSGHDDFEYAQLAIQYQTINYLLKPVDINELIHSVQTAIQDIEREWSEISSYERIKQTLHANIPLLQNKLLNDLIQNKSVQADMLEEQLSLIHVPFKLADPYIMMVVRLEEEFSKYDFNSLSLFESAVCNIAEEVFHELFELWHCTSEQGYLVFLINCRNNEAIKLVDSYAVKLQNNVQKFLKGSLSICLSNPGTFPHGVAEFYYSSVSVIQRNVGKNKSYFITIDNTSEEAPETNMVNMFEAPSLSTLLESGKWEEAITKIESILSTNDPTNELTYNQLFTVLLYLSSSFAMVISSENVTVEEQLGEEFNLLMYKKSQLSKHRILAWAEKIINSIMARSSQRIDDSQQQIASKVRKFIDDHLNEGITLQLIADYIGLHPVYLSKVYKTSTGETIGNYLFRIRMERAAYLLLKTDLKIMEISSKLGFLATPHFIKIFKKHFGCTPQEYRNR